MNLYLKKLLNLANKFDQMTKLSSEEVNEEEYTVRQDNYKKWNKERTTEAFDGEFGDLAKEYAKEFPEALDDVWLITPENIDLLFKRLKNNIMYANNDGGYVDVLGEKEIQMAKKKLRFLMKNRNAKKYMSSMLSGLSLNQHNSSEKEDED